MKEALVVFDSNHNPTIDAYKKLSKDKRDTLDKFEKYCLISANAGRAKKEQGTIRHSKNCSGGLGDRLHFYSLI
jgi:hypothetical protein